jgi:hypothetical protein
MLLLLLLLCQGRCCLLVLSKHSLLLRMPGAGISTHSTLLIRCGTAGTRILHPVGVWQGNHRPVLAALGPPSLPLGSWVKAVGTPPIAVVPIGPRVSVSRVLFLRTVRPSAGAKAAISSVRWLRIGIAIGIAILLIGVRRLIMRRK